LSSYFASQGKIDTTQKMHVVHHNTLPDSFRIRIVWFQPKQESDRLRISIFKNRIGLNSKNPLSDHLCYRGVHGWILDFLDPDSGCFQQDQEWGYLSCSRILMDFVFTEKTLLVLCLTYISRTQTGVGFLETSCTGSGLDSD